MPRILIAAVALLIATGCQAVLSVGSRGDAGDAGEDAGPCTWDGGTYPKGATDPENPALCCNPTAEVSNGWVLRLTPTQYQIGPSPAGIAAGDFDGKGVFGLAAVANQQLVILQRIGDVFVDAGAYPLRGIAPLAGGCVGQIAAGDLNKDGRADVVVANCGDNSYEVFLSQPDGTLLGATYPLLGDPIGVALADVNGDGLLDLLVAVYDLSRIAVLLALPDGGFGVERHLGAGLNPNTLTVSDFDRDGILDLAVSNQAPNDNTIWVYKGLGDGNFRRIGIYSGAPDGGRAGGVSWVSSGDLDGDGNPDLVAASFYGNDAALLLGNGDGTFSTQYINAGVGYGPSAMIVADVDGDRQNDLVLANQIGDGIDVYHWDRVSSSPKPWFSTFSIEPQALVSLPHPRSASVDLAFLNLGIASDTVTVMVNGCP
jgi:FG-GAP-like repeat